MRQVNVYPRRNEALSKQNPLPIREGAIHYIQYSIINSSIGTGLE